MRSDSLALKQEFEVSAVTSIHFFEYKSNFIFKSEYHDYWKLLYVEEGMAEIASSGHENSPELLHPGQIFIQAPDEYYSFKAADHSVPRLFTCGFYCNSSPMKLLCNKIFHCTQTEKALLSHLIDESRESFSTKIDSSGIYTLERKLNQPFGGEQLTRIYLEMLLISLMRQSVSPSAEKEADLSSLSKTDSILFNRITDYYSSHIAEKISIEDICHEFSIGRAHLQRIFREHTGLGAIEYFCQMRISAAKQLIRENKMNLTDTAKTLGYTSIHYFSKQFKKITGIPPSRYQESIRSAGNDPIYQQIELEQKKEWGE